MTEPGSQQVCADHTLNKGRGCGGVGIGHSHHELQGSLKYSNSENQAMSPRADKLPDLSALTKTPVVERANPRDNNHGQWKRAVSVDQRPGVKKESSDCTERIKNEASSAVANQASAQPDITHLDHGVLLPVQRAANGYRHFALTVSNAHLTLDYAPAIKLFVQVGQLP